MKNKLNLNEALNLFKIEHLYDSKLMNIAYNISDLKNKCVCAYERARYGVSREDTWNLDSYVKTVLENGIKLLKEDTIGCPATMTFDEWKEQLDILSLSLHYINTDVMEMPYIEALWDRIMAETDKEKEAELRKLYSKKIGEETDRQERVWSKICKWLDKNMYNLWW